jgi:hypothetical protein
MLKQGLLQERRMIYDSAIAIYYQTMEVVFAVFQKSQIGKKFFGRNIEQLNLLIQPYLCLAFLHAKRDHSLKTANRFMEDALEKLIKKNHYYKEYGFLYVEKSEQTDKCDSFAEKSGQIYKHYIRWAELYMMRSQFEGAIYKYLQAMKALCQCCTPDENKDNAMTYHDIGSILAGLADACTALVFSDMFSTKVSDFKVSDFSVLPLPLFTDEKNQTEESDSELDIQCAYNENLSNDELKRNLCKKVRLILNYWKENLEHDSKFIKIKKLKPLFSNALHLYVLASHAYRLAGSFMDEILMLWKTAYAVGFGLSNLNTVYGKNLTVDEKAKINWLFMDLEETKTEGATYETNSKNPIRSIFPQALGGSYSIYRERLRREIGMKNEHLLRWISPPLVQLLTVLAHFWYAFWGDADKNGNPCKMDESTFEIIDMGTFPMNARILALYLKGCWYQKYAIGENEYQYKRKAFRLLVQAIEHEQAYENELDYLALPLGFIFYHLWEIVKENDNNNEILNSIKKDEEFKEDMQRYFVSNYCRKRAKKQLMELLSRHNIAGINKDRYFTYMSKHYYLYNAFSDSYVNGMWALEYGLVPVAQFMLDEINKHSNDPFFD